MSKERPRIVYMGNQERGERLQQMAGPLGWTILTATQKLQALAMYVFYFPDLVIVDCSGNPAEAEEVLFHLQSVQAEPILVLAEPHAGGDAGSGTAVVMMSSASEESSILVAVARLLQLEPGLC